MDELEASLRSLDEPSVTLPDPLPPDEPYTPRTNIGALVKASLGRAIGRSSPADR
jgi:hypothetical protein